MSYIPHRYGAPVLAVCGFSGSGKTTLLEASIPRLIERGLSVAVIKHDAHGVAVDTPGKDSDRLFRAGASVILRGPDQQFQRRNAASSLSLTATLADMARDHDLLLVEGHKDTPLPKFWLEHPGDTAIPENVTNVLASLSWNSNRLQAFLDFVDERLPRAWCERSLYGGMLIGGKSSRMGSPKQLLRLGGNTLGNVVTTALKSCAAISGVVVLGAGTIPESRDSFARLPDAPGFQGPCAGLIAAHRWDPAAAWIVAACDHPWLRKDDIHWLASLRRPGTWAVIPLQEDGHPCPTLALYEPQGLAALERQAMEDPQRKGRTAVLIDHPRTVLINPPGERSRAWRNLNTPEEFKAAEEQLRNRFLAGDNVALDD